MTFLSLVCDVIFILYFCVLFPTHPLAVAAAGSLLPLYDYYDFYDFCETPWQTPAETVLFGSKASSSNNTGAASSIFVNNSMTISSKTAKFIVYSPGSDSDVFLPNPVDSSPALVTEDAFGFRSEGNCEVEDAAGKFSLDGVHAAEIRFMLYSGRNASSLSSTSSSIASTLLNRRTILSALCSQSVQQIRFTSFAADALSDSTWLHYFSGATTSEEMMLLVRNSSYSSATSSSLLGPVLIDHGSDTTTSFTLLVNGTNTEVETRIAPSTAFSLRRTTSPSRTHIHLEPYGSFQSVATSICLVMFESATSASPINNSSNHDNNAKSNHTLRFQLRHIGFLISEVSLRRIESPLLSHAVPMSCDSSYPANSGRVDVDTTCHLGSRYLTVRIFLSGFACTPVFVAPVNSSTASASSSPSPSSSTPSFIKERLIGSISFNGGRAFCGLGDVVRAASQPATAKQNERAFFASHGIYFVHGLLGGVFSRNSSASTDANVYVECTLSLRQLFSSSSFLNGTLNETASSELSGDGADEDGDSNSGFSTPDSAAGSLTIHAQLIWPGISSPVSSSSSAAKTSTVFSVTLVTPSPPNNAYSIALPASLAGFILVFFYTLCVIQERFSRNVLPRFHFNISNSNNDHENISSNIVIGVIAITNLAHFRSTFGEKATRMNLKLVGLVVHDEIRRLGDGGRINVAAQTSDDKILLYSCCPARRTTEPPSQEEKDTVHSMLQCCDAIRLQLIATRMKSSEKFFIVPVENDSNDEDDEDGEARNQQQQQASPRQQPISPKVRMLDPSIAMFCDLYHPDKKKDVLKSFYNRQSVQVDARDGSKAKQKKHYTEQLFGLLAAFSVHVGSDYFIAEGPHNKENENGGENTDYLDDDVDGEEQEFQRDFKILLSVRRSQSKQNSTKRSNPHVERTRGRHHRSAVPLPHQRQSLRIHLSGALVDSACEVINEIMDECRMHRNGNGNNNCSNNCSNNDLDDNYEGDIYISKEARAFVIEPEKSSNNVTLLQLAQRKYRCEKIAINRNNDMGFAADAALCANQKCDQRHVQEMVQPRIVAQRLLHVPQEVLKSFVSSSASSALSEKYSSPPPCAEPTVDPAALDDDVERLPPPGGEESPLLPHQLPRQHEQEQGGEATSCSIPPSVAPAVACDRKKSPDATLSSSSSPPPTTVVIRPNVEAVDEFFDAVRRRTESLVVVHTLSRPRSNSKQQPHNINETSTNKRSDFYRLVVADVKKCEEKCCHQNQRLQQQQQQQTMNKNLILRQLHLVPSFFSSKNTPTLQSDAAGTRTKKIVVIKAHLELEQDFDERPKDYIAAFMQSHLTLVAELCQKFPGSRIESVVNGDFVISFNNNNHSNKRHSNNNNNNTNIHSKLSPSRKNLPTTAIVEESELTCGWYLFCDQLSKLLTKGRYWKEYEREQEANKRRMILQILDEQEDRENRKREKKQGREQQQQQQQQQQQPQNSSNNADEEKVQRPSQGQGKYRDKKKGNALKSSKAEDGKPSVGVSRSGSRWKQPDNNSDPAAAPALPSPVVDGSNANNNDNININNRSISSKVRVAVGDANAQQKSRGKESPRANNSNKDNVDETTKISASMKAVVSPNLGDGGDGDRGTGDNNNKNITRASPAFASATTTAEQQQQKTAKRKKHVEISVDPAANDDDDYDDQQKQQNVALSASPSKDASRSGSAKKKFVQQTAVAHNSSKSLDTPGVVTHVVDDANENTDDNNNKNQNDVETHVNKKKSSASSTASSLRTSSQRQKSQQQQQQQPQHQSSSTSFSRADWYYQRYILPTLEYFSTYTPLSAFLRRTVKNGIASSVVGGDSNAAKYLCHRSVQFVSIGVAFGECSHENSPYFGGQVLNEAEALELRHRDLCREFLLLQQQRKDFDRFFASTKASFASSSSPAPSLHRTASPRTPQPLLSPPSTTSPQNKDITMNFNTASCSFSSRDTLSSSAFVGEGPTIIIAAAAAAANANADANARASSGSNNTSGDNALSVEQELQRLADPIEQLSDESSVAGTCCAISHKSDLIRQRQFDSYFCGAIGSNPHHSCRETSALCAMIACRKSCWVGVTSFLRSQNHQQQQEPLRENVGVVVLMQIREKSESDLKLLQRMQRHQEEMQRVEKKNAHDEGAVTDEHEDEQREEKYARPATFSSSSPEQDLQERQNSNSTDEVEASAEVIQQWQKSQRGRQQQQQQQRPQLHSDHYKRLQPFGDVNRAMQEFFGNFLSLNVNADGGGVDDDDDDDSNFNNVDDHNPKTKSSLPSSPLLPLPAIYVSRVLTPEQRVLRRYAIAILRREWQIVTSVISDQRVRAQQLASYQKVLARRQREMLQHLLASLEEQVKTVRSNLQLAKKHTDEHPDEIGDVTTNNCSPPNDVKADNSSKKRNGSRRSRVQEGTASTFRSPSAEASSSPSSSSSSSSSCSIDDLPATTRTTTTTAVRKHPQQHTPSATTTSNNSGNNKLNGDESSVNDDNNNKKTNKSSSANAGNAATKRTTSKEEVHRHHRVQPPGSALGGSKNKTQQERPVSMTDLLPRQSTQVAVRHRKVDPYAMEAEPTMNNPDGSNINDDDNNNNNNKKNSKEVAHKHSRSKPNSRSVQQHNETYYSPTEDAELDAEDEAILEESNSHPFAQLRGTPLQLHLTSPRIRSHSRQRQQKNDDRYADDDDEAE